MQPNSTTDNPPEEWRPIPGYEGFYEISNVGRVKRIAATRGSCPGRILRAIPNRQGYTCVGLWRNGKGKGYRIASLIKGAFPELFEPEAINHDEEWRKVPGFEGFYEVSNLGRVRRSAPGGNGTYIGRILGRRVDSNGYRHVLLCINGIDFGRKVHSLVAAAFLGPRPMGWEVNHKDGDKEHNAIENLEYVSGSQNVRHAFLSGLRRSKLTELDVTLIRGSSEPQRALASRFGVSETTISEIKNGKKHIHGL